MAQGRIDGVKGTSGLGSTMRMAIDAMKLIGDMAQQQGRSSSNNDLQGLQNGLNDNQNNAANQVLPTGGSDDADGAKGLNGNADSQSQGSPAGVNQQILELLRMIARMMQQGSDANNGSNNNGSGSGSGSAAPLSSPSARNVARQLPGSGNGSGNVGSSPVGAPAVNTTPSTTASGPTVGSSSGNAIPAFTPGTPSTPVTPSTPITPATPATPTVKTTPTATTRSGSFSTAPVTGPLSTADGQTMAVNTAKRLENDFGFTKDQAAGIVGNLDHESAGMNSNVNEFNSDPSSPTYGAPNSTQFGYGWAQWTGSRKTDFLNYSKADGLDPSSPEANYQFLKHELETSESGTVAAVKQTQDAGDAATAFRKVYERATNPVDSSRIADANQIDAELS